MSKMTFKIRKNCLYLRFVNYKFINSPIFAPPPIFDYFYISVIAILISSF